MAQIVHDIAPGAAIRFETATVWPVRVSAGAFGHGLPERDLMLSPGHPVLVGADADNAGGHLVPVMCLINGTSIRKVQASSVTYWHIELDAHDVLLAEGLPAESYLDWGDRAFFTEGADHALANPDFVVPGLAGRCRPVAVDGRGGCRTEPARHGLRVAAGRRLCLAQLRRRSVGGLAPVASRIANRRKHAGWPEVIIASGRLRLL